MLCKPLLAVVVAVSTSSAAIAADIPFAANCEMYGILNPILPTALAAPKIPKSLLRFAVQINKCAATTGVNFVEHYTLCQGKANFILDRVSKDVYQIPSWEGIRVEVGCNLLSFTIGPDTHYRVWDPKTHTLGIPTDSTD